jgi:outer membrane murein-binding lipoprotein Lpp
MDLDEVADELYGLPLADFVATRNAKAKQARAEGDRALAAAITALGKPSKVAWLANQLVRERADDIEPLLALGAALREATATLSGDDLRQLTRQQHQLVHALVQQAKSLVDGPVSDDVADGLDRTLRAALADAELAAQLQRGRLVDGLEFTGFGGAGPPGGERPRLTVVGKEPVARKPLADKQAAERARAEKALAEAQNAAAAAESERAAAQAVVDEAATQTRRLADQVDQLRADLEQAQADHVAAERDARAARTALERSERAIRAAERRLDHAEQSVAGLPPVG